MVVVLLLFIFDFSLFTTCLLRVISEAAVPPGSTREQIRARTPAAVRCCRGGLAWLPRKKRSRRATRSERPHSSLQ